MRFFKVCAVIESIYGRQQRRLFWNAFTVGFHFRLESLRTLILADNLLTRIQLTTDDITFNDIEESDWSVVGVTKLRLMFPNLSMLDISNNCLKVSSPVICCDSSDVIWLCSLLVFRKFLNRYMSSVI